MKVGLFNHVMKHHMSRRKMLQGAASVGAVAAAGGIGTRPADAAAHGNIRARNPEDSRRGRRFAH